MVAEIVTQPAATAGTLAPTRGEDRILIARKLVKTYDSGEVEVHALRGLNLDIRRGEMVAIMGPSGCGKTTLLNCLSGIDDFTSGEVWIAGKPLSRMGDNEKTDFRAMRMGFIFQNYNLLPVLRAVENVELPLLVRGDDPKGARRKALAALAAVGLEEEAPKKPAELSGGQQQRVAIARALVNEPDVVFADEPTGNLDSRSGAELLAFMRKATTEFGQTIVMVTHDPVAASYADSALFLADGRVVGVLDHPTPQRVLDHMKRLEV